MAVLSSPLGLSHTRRFLAVAGITPFDSELIEHTRKINKTLSMFVFALQEGGEIPVEGQLAIVSFLETLAETVLLRAAAQLSDNNDGQGIKGHHSWPPALGPGRGTGDGS